MKRLGTRLGCLLLLFTFSCSQAHDLLPDGPELGDYSDVEEPETYRGPGLYTYMDGGAEFYLQHGLSALYVRRYARGQDRFVVELFEMKDDDDATEIYESARRPEAETELAGGCLASVTPGEIQFSKGRYYLVGRNEDPMAPENQGLIELCRRLAERLEGRCPVAARR